MISQKPPPADAKLKLGFQRGQTRRDFRIHPPFAALPERVMLGGVQDGRNIRPVFRQSES